MQAYLGRNAFHGVLKPQEYRKNPHDPMVLHLPVEQFLTDKGESETYKQVTSLIIKNVNINYTCPCKAFVVFASEQEVNCAKSSTLRPFQGVSSIEHFLQLGLPIKRTTKPPQQNESIAFEIDLS